MNKPDHYLANNVYEALLKAIMNPAQTADQQTQLVETLGDAGIWPQSCLDEKMRSGESTS